MLILCLLVYTNPYASFAVLSVLPEDGFEESFAMPEVCAPQLHPLLYLNAEYIAVSSSKSCIGRDIYELGHSDYS